MTTRIAEIIHEWMGWCPNAPALRTTSTMLTTPPVTVNPLEPDGRAGGSGWIVRGISLATGSIKTMMRNKQLLWFSFLTGLVMLFMIAAEFSLRVYGSYPYPEIGYALWLALTFIIEMITVFCIYFLLAGLILSQYQNSSGRPATLREGLSSARSHVNSIAGWSVVMALLGTAVFALSLQTLYYGYPYNGYLPSMFYAMINQFPFNFLLLPEVYSTGPIGGSFNVSSTVTLTLFSTMINIIFFILTLFVLPVLVLENKRLPGAVAESISLSKKVWGEIISCFLIFGLILLVISLTSFIFRIAYGVVSPDMLLFWYPNEGWIAGAGLYMLVSCILMVIGSTAVGISLFGLYTYAKSGRMPGIPE